MPSDSSPSARTAQGRRSQGPATGDDGSAIWSVVQETELFDALQKAVVEIVDRVRIGVREDVQQLLEQRLDARSASTRRPLASASSGGSVMTEQLLRSDDLIRTCAPPAKVKPVGPSVNIPEPPEESDVVLPPTPEAQQLNRGVGGGVPDSPRGREVYSRARNLLSPEPEGQEAAPKRHSVSSRDSKGSLASSVVSLRHGCWAHGCPRSYFAMHELVADNEEARAALSRGSTTNFMMSRSFTALDMDSPLSTANIGTLGNKKTTWRALRLRAARIVRSSMFDYAVSFVVVLSAVFIGLQTDYMSSHIGQPVPMGYRISERAFLTIFIAELGLRWFVHGRRLFYMPTWRWTILDFALIGVQLTEEILSAAAQIWNLSVIRAVRVVRLIRIIRVIRVLHLVCDFRTMVNAMSCALRPFVSALCLVMLMVYIVGVYIMQMVIEHHHHDQPGAFAANAELQLYWGSLGVGTLSLCQSLLGGLAWGRMVDPLVKTISSALAPLFLCYVAFASFVMLNLINGVFSDLTFRNIKENKDRELIGQVMELFIGSDSNHSGRVSWEEFESQLRNPLMEKYFQARGLFDLLDVTGEGSIAAQDFVMGCLHLRGPAKALDLAQLSRDIDAMYTFMQKEMTEVMSMLVDVHMLVKSKSDTL